AAPALRAMSVTVNTLPSQSVLLPPFVAVLVPSPVHARLLKRHAVGLRVVPERAVHVLVPVPGQQHDLQGIAHLHALAVGAWPLPGCAARFPLTECCRGAALCSCDADGIAVHVLSQADGFAVTDH